MKKVAMTLLVISGITLILVAVSVAAFPQWLAIPGGVLILVGIALNAILDAGSKIRDWVDLLFANEKGTTVSKAQSNNGDIKQQGGPNIIAKNIDHLEVYNSPPLAGFHPEIDNLTVKQKNALRSLVRLGHSWREEFYIVWHEPIGISDILDYDGNPPQISKGDIRALEREGLLICKFLGNDKAHITLVRKSFDALSVLSEEVNLTITPQEKYLEDNSYIIINVANNENKPVFCRAEIRGIYNKTGENIKRKISQYANLFSWSGGSQNGTKEILSRLDGTVNLVERRISAYGIYFLFHENPDTNWKIPGIYKLDLMIRGTIGETDVIGKKMTINFEYIEKEERDSMGGFFNRGVLKLLEWNVEENSK